MMMINAHNLSMGCFPIFYLHKAFRGYLYHGWVSLCLQFYVCLSVCIVGCENWCGVFGCKWCVSCVWFKIMLPMTLYVCGKKSQSWNQAET